MNVKIKQRDFKDQVLTDKERKNLMILSILTRYGQSSRVDIAKISQYNLVTVSNYSNNFLRNSIIEEKGVDSSASGRKPVLLDFNYRSGFVLGVGVSEDFSKISVVLIDFGCNLLEEYSVDWDPSIQSEELVNRMIELTKEFVERSDYDSDLICGIGVGVPGSVMKYGNVVRWNNSIGDMNVSISVPIRSLFESAFPNKVIVIDRSMVVAASGERWVGLSFGINNLFFYHSLTSVGMILNSSVYRGATGLSGLLGEYREGILDKDFMEDSNLNVSQMIKKYYVGEEFSLEKIVSRASQGNVDALMAVRKTAERVGHNIAILNNFLDVEAIVLEGVFDDSSLFFDFLRKEFNKWSVNGSSSNVTIAPSFLGENVVAHGAATVFLQEWYSQVGNYLEQ